MAQVIAAGKQGIVSSVLPFIIPSSWSASFCLIFPTTNPTTTLFRGSNAIHIHASPNSWRTYSKPSKSFSFLKRNSRVHPIGTPRGGILASYILLPPPMCSPTHSINDPTLSLFTPAMRVVTRTPLPPPRHFTI